MLDFGLTDDHEPVRTSRKRVAVARQQAALGRLLEARRLAIWDEWLAWCFEPAGTDQRLLLVAKALRVSYRKQYARALELEAALRSVIAGSLEAGL